METNKYGFIDVKDIFKCPEFVGRNTTDHYMEYCCERNEKDGWTTETVLDGLMKETAVRSDANA